MIVDLESNTTIANLAINNSMTDIGFATIMWILGQSMDIRSLISNFG